MVVSRWAHWEFWPTWATYPPVVAWIAFLAARHGGLRPITAANPGLADGGLVGESKHEIQRRLPPTWAVPSAAIEPGDRFARWSELDHAMTMGAWPYPIVLKPDVGQRGVGVRKIAGPEEARAYLDSYPGRAIAQPWHPGPFEAGLFYARHPGEPRGRVLSITNKIFPVVTGDGRRTIEELVLAHPRLRLQAPVFLARHATERRRRLADGEAFPLGEVGNHAQGTLFLDGRELWTPALEVRIDQIAQAIPGFFIGRFDVRFADVERFKAGDDLAIIELNGVAAEPTDIYDPSRSIASAYAALFDQWRRVFAIGSANLRGGHQGASAMRLAWLAVRHLADRRRFPVSS